MPYAEELIERLLNHWRETGSTIAVEAAAEIGVLKEMVAVANDRAVKDDAEVARLNRQAAALRIEAADRKEAFNKLVHRIQELEAREQ
jgi:hypothetical protein